MHILMKRIVHWTYSINTPCPINADPRGSCLQGHMAKTEIWEVQRIVELLHPDWWRRARVEAEQKDLYVAAAANGAPSPARSTSAPAGGEEPLERKGPGGTQQPHLGHPQHGQHCNAAETTRHRTQNCHQTPHSEVSVPFHHLQKEHFSSLLLDFQRFPERFHKYRRSEGLRRTPEVILWKILYQEPNCSRVAFWALGRLLHIRCHVSQVYLWNMLLRSENAILVYI